MSHSFDTIKALNEWVYTDKVVPDRYDLEMLKAAKEFKLQGLFEVCELRFCKYLFTLFFEKWTIPGLFFFFCLFYRQLPVNICSLKVATDRI